MSRRLVPALLIATFMTAVSGTARLSAQDQSTTVIYLVRHAETDADGTQDPPLSPSGVERAAQLSGMLSGAGLSNTTPELVRLLGGDPRGPIAEDEYGRVYVVTIGDEEVHTLVSGYPGGFSSDSASADQKVMEERIEDVESVESILAALYDVLSGPAGEARDWDRLRSLFLQSARMVPVQRAPDGNVRYRALTVEEYIESSGPVIEDLGFRETEIARQVEHFGEVAHVFSRTDLMLSR